jgi:hypothetical protein
MSTAETLRRHETVSAATPGRGRLGLRHLDAVDAADRDCYTWHLQQCISLDYTCNCYLIVMRPAERARRDSGFSEKNGPPPEGYRGKQRPTAPVLRARAARIWPGTFNERTRTQPYQLVKQFTGKLPSRPSPLVGAPRAFRGHLGHRRRRCVSVIVSLPNHNEAPRPQTSQCRFRALRNGLLKG